MDGTKCTNETCSTRESCYRWTSGSSLYWQAIQHFKEKDCKYYINNKGL